MSNEADNKIETGNYILQGFATRNGEIVAVVSMSAGTNKAYSTSMSLDQITGNMEYIESLDQKPDEKDLTLTLEQQGDYCNLSQLSSALYGLKAHIAQEEIDKLQKIGDKPGDVNSFILEDGTKLGDIEAGNQMDDFDPRIKEETGISLQTPIPGLK